MLKREWYEEDLRIYPWFHWNLNIADDEAALVSDRRDLLRDASFFASFLSFPPSFCLRGPWQSTIFFGIASFFPFSDLVLVNSLMLVDKGISAGDKDVGR